MLFVRMGLTVIVALFTSRIVLQQLGISDFGIYNVVGGIVSLMTFINTSMTHGIQRYINYYKAKNDLASETKIFSSSVTIIFGLILLFILLAETLGLWFLNTCINIPQSRMYVTDWVYQLSVIACIINMLQIPFTALIVANEDMQIYAYISFLEVGLKLSIAFLICITPMDKLVVYAILMMLVTAIVSISYFLYCRLKYPSCRFRINTEKSIYANLISFSGWTIIGTSANLISVQGMNIILNIFFGTIVNAARGIAIQISTQLDNLINNIQIAMNPQLIQLYSCGKIYEMRNLLIDNFKWNFYLFWICGCPILFNTEKILCYWLGELPEYTIIFTQLIVIRCLLKAFERPLITATMAYGKMKYPSIISGGCLISEIIVAWFLFNWGFQPYWAYIIDLFAIFVCIIYDIAFLRRHEILGFRFFLQKVIFNTSCIICTSMFLSIIVCRIIDDSSFLLFLIRVLIVMLLCVISIYTIGLTHLQRQILFLKIKNVFNANH